MGEEKEKDWDWVGVKGWRCCCGGGGGGGGGRDCG